MFRFILTAIIPVALLFSGLLFADDPDAGDSRDKETQAKASEVEALKVNDKKQEGIAEFQLGEDLRKAIIPFFESIKNAKVSRATVEMLTDSVLNGQVVESHKSTFQIASQSPGKFTVYLKEPQQRTRIYCDGKNMVAAMAPDAFFRMKDPVSIQDAVTSLSVPMGPYPEPLLALTMASADPAITFLAGMKSIRLIDRKPFRSKVPSVHFRGVQADEVTWDLWVTDDGEEVRPLRLLIDLTPMLAASDQVHVPDGFSHQVRYDFLSWRVTGDVEDSLFTFNALSEATQYESLEDYFDKMTQSASRHPLLGKKAPLFKANWTNGKVLSTKDLAGKVIVLDFWATWCTPCLAAMPIVQEVCEKYGEKGVVFVPLNTGQEMKEVNEFLEAKEWSLRSLLDPGGKIADGFHAGSIPMTVLIGKSGSIESVHIGFSNEEELRDRLVAELEVLVVGGRIGSVAETNAKEAEAATEKKK